MKSKLTKKCLTCIPTSQKIANTTKKRADWKSRRGLKTIFPDDKIPDLSQAANLKEIVPKNANQHIEINLGRKKAGRYVLYYAADQCPMSNCANCHLLDANQAYGSFKNQGLTRLDSEGKAILKIQCPRPYREENRSYLPHVHFIVSQKDNLSWEHKLMTQTVVCHLNYSEMEQLVQKGCAMVINALPFEYYVKDRIPMSIPLDHNLVLDKLTKKEVIQYLKVMVAHYPSLHKAVSTGKMELLDVPIVSYCYNPECEADTDLQEKLNKIGFTNVKLYPGGIKEWRRKNKNPNTKTRGKDPEEVNISS